MRKFILLTLSFVISLSIIGCGMKQEDGKKLKNFDETLQKYFQDQKINAKVQTKINDGNIVTYVQVKNDMDISKNKSLGEKSMTAEERYLLKVYNDTFFIFGAVAGLADGFSEDLKEAKPTSVSVTTKSDSIKGEVKAGIKLEDIYILKSKNRLNDTKEIWRLSTITSDNKNLNKLIEDVKKTVKQ